MIALAHIYERIAHAAGHVLAVPFAATLLALLWIWAGLDLTNLAISIVSLLLLFILQSTQNRDGLAIQAKLDALIKGVPQADNKLERIEEKTEQEIKIIREQCDD